MRCDASAGNKNIHLCLSSSGVDHQRPPHSEPGKLGSGAALLNHTSQPSGTLPLGPQVMGTQPMGSQPMGTQSMGTQPMGTQPMGTQSMGTQPMGTQPMGTQPMGTQPMGTQPMATQPMGSQSMGAQNAMGSMQDNHNKKLSGQDLLNQARGTLDKKPGIMRQGSMGRDPPGLHGGLSTGVGGLRPQGTAQARMGQHGVVGQTRPSSQGPHVPTTQDMAGSTTLPSGARTSKLPMCQGAKVPVASNTFLEKLKHAALRRW